MLARSAKGQHRFTMLPLWIFILLGITASACSSSTTNEDAQALTAGSVDRAYAEAAECLTDEGYSVETQRLENNWSIAFEGVPDETNEFFGIYDRCVGDAEVIERAYLRTQIPEGAERVELAAEFQTCLRSAGVENPVAYDPNSPNQASVLADAQIQLGYALDDPTVTEDPRFTAVLRCLETYELLFPDRFEALD